MMLHDRLEKAVDTEEPAGQRLLDAVRTIDTLAGGDASLLVDVSAA